ncbi:hypothetical protein ABW19_dt0201409 [Dactylella cylindrospora]|nr:hypothetical protein ABW19_dt0201409 [Dactylella cylindrospora]
MIFSFKPVLLVAILAACQDVVALPGGNIIARTACAANNCARAVTGTANGGASRTSRARSDCSSFMAVTSTTTPATATNTDTVTESLTITDTATVTETVYGEVEVAKRSEPTPTGISYAEEVALHDALQNVKRQAPSNTIPTYASPCPNASAYVSACSCWGIVAPTIWVTAPTPQTTVFETVTETSYTTVPATETTTVYQPSETGVLRSTFGLNGNHYVINEIGYNHWLYAASGETFVWNAGTLYNTNVGVYASYEGNPSWPYWFDGSDLAGAIKTFSLTDDGSGTQGKIGLIKDGVPQKFYGSTGSTHIYFAATVPSGWTETEIFLIYA